MIVSIFDYGSGNIKSVSKAVELAANNLQKNISVQVINSADKIKKADKIRLNLEKNGILIEDLNDKTHWKHK